jgi:hypothetical protein
MFIFFTSSLSLPLSLRTPGNENPETLVFFDFMNKKDNKKTV